MPKRTIYIFVITGILISVIIILKYKNNFFPANKSPSSSSNYYHMALPVLSEESESKIPQGFPRQFILGKAPEVVSGESFNTTPNTVDMAVIFKDPSISIQELVSEYENYAVNTGWSVNESTADTGIRTFDLKRGIQSVSLEIKNNSPNGVLVKISYHAITNAN